MPRSSSCSKQKQQLHSNATWPWDRLDVFSLLSCNPVWIPEFCSGRWQRIIQLRGAS